MTSLATGQRVPKTSPRLEAYGTADELMSWIGVIASSDSCPADMSPHLRNIQNKLFNIGAYLASEAEDKQQIGIYNFGSADIEAMEHEIDRMDNEVTPLHQFILPGGSQLSAFTHVARTVCRRVERLLLQLNGISPVNPEVLQYINRLSDYLFVAAKYINTKAGIPEVTWDKDA